MKPAFPAYTVLEINNKLNLLLIWYFRNATLYFSLINIIFIYIENAIELYLLLATNEIVFGPQTTSEYKYAIFPCKDPKTIIKYFNEYEVA